MEENTTPISPETPPVEKKDEKKSGPGFTDHVREGWRKAHNKLGTGGVIAVILALIIIAMLGSHDGRRDRYEYGFHNGGPMMYQDQGHDRAMMQDMKDSWDAMNERMDALESRRDNMMQKSLEKTREVQAVENPSSPTMNSQYSGYRSIDGTTLGYTVRLSEGTLTGTITSDDEATLKEYAQELSDVDGLSITGKSNQLQLSGKANTLEEVIKILDNK